MVDVIATGCTEVALIRRATPIMLKEITADAEAQLRDMLLELYAPCPRFISEL